MVEHLLTNRVSVLDVGRIELGGPPNDESYRGVLDLSSRLGARFVTAGGVGVDQQVTPLQDEFGRLVADCEDYQARGRRAPGDRSGTCADSGRVAR